MTDLRTRTSRRRFLQLLGGFTASAWTLAGSVAPRAADAAEAATSQAAADAAGAAQIPESVLEESPYVYVSPLLADDRESQCHAELWYAWLDDSFVVIVDSQGWKAKALARGLDTARIWVGDYGRWKGWFGTRNESFRRAPSVVARAERVRDATMVDRLLAVYEEKYPEEIADWRGPMREGAANGSRVILRYRALS